MLTLVVFLNGTVSLLTNNLVLFEHIVSNLLPGKSAISANPQRGQNTSTFCSSYFQIHLPALGARSNFKSHLLNELHGSKSFLGKNSKS